MFRAIEISLRKKLASIENRDNNSLVVIKGIPLHLVGVEKADIEKIANEKFQNFGYLVTSRQKYISYEEYLLLHTFIIKQYNSIYIIENNQFINLFPFYQKINDETFTRLKIRFESFDASEQEDIMIGDLTQYTEAFVKCDDLDGFKYVAYQDPPETDQDYKIHMIPLFDIYSDNLESTILTDEQLNDGRRVIEINDEIDYLRLVRMIMSEVDEITVLYQNSDLDSKRLERSLTIIKEFFSEYVVLSIARVELSLKPTKVYPECKDILEKHWGATKTFRTIKVYDLNRLEHQEKIIVEVSQERIISDLISEVEKSMSGDFYRDVFVTAPTGSGKSAMFQIPAIYLAEKYEVMTIVISPLIGLMNDQIEGLNYRSYHYARTIHSDISPIMKQQIMEDIQSKKCHLLYISPETLLSRSDITQLIGTRQLGLLVIDEAHIVTTWGKQFRPDYWFLGDYVSKLRQKINFVIATFTATAIYGGIENMFADTKQSLRMVSPIVWLGYMRREDIIVNVREVKRIANKTEYEINKFDSLIQNIDRSLILGKKTLVYFPTVALIQRFYEYAQTHSIQPNLSKYHGQLLKTEKIENYEEFKSGRKPIMLATKAFGMGIDIEDIEVVIHFAPTGNVCDYVQEIGRVARRSDIIGDAIYEYMSNDFKHINRLHGLSSIRKYQLTQVIEKVYELFTNKIRQGGAKAFTRKMNSMLIDAESFAYIFDGRMNDQDDALSKVKSAMLMIQKDYENRYGFSPFYIRPIPMFAWGYFQLSENDRNKLAKKFPDMIQQKEKETGICLIDLNGIWEKAYKSEFSFPQMKYLIYTKDNSLNLNHEVDLQPALCVDVNIFTAAIENFSKYFESFKGVINQKIRDRSFVSVEELVEIYSPKIHKSLSFARNICEVMIAGMYVYKQFFSRRATNNWLKSKELKSGEMHYAFEAGVDDYFAWVERGFRKVINIKQDQMIYVVNSGSTNVCREATTQLGILESLDVLNFSTLGGANSQLYIHVNQTQALKRVIDKPAFYENRLMNLINDRHNLSVEMLSFLFGSEFESERIWDYLEEYFLGIIPEAVKKSCEEKYRMNLNGF